MRWDSLEEEQCSLARTVAVIGDRWSLLILRECFLRVRRFEKFQSRLGITRYLLADRLKKFVRYGVLHRARYQESPARYEYILTQRGLDLYPVVMSIVHWGDTHMVDERGRPLLHQHKNCGKMFDPLGMRRAGSCQGSAHASGAWSARGYCPGEGMSICFAVRIVR
jgi:DNA-binding HxlR family transcriptional regulator